MSLVTVIRQGLARRPQQAWCSTSRYDRGSERRAGPIRVRDACNGPVAFMQSRVVLSVCFMCEWQVRGLICSVLLLGGCWK